MTHPTEAEADTARGFLNVQRQFEVDVRVLTETAERGRKRSIDLARRYGLEWETIGHHLRMSGEAARKWHERHQDI